MELYVPPGQRSAGVLGTGQRRWREERRPKSDFEVLIENIKDTPMYQVIREDLAPYENWRYHPNRGAGSNGRDRRIPLNEDGVQVFLFNDPIYRDDFFKIIDQYRSFYGLTHSEIRNKEYLIKHTRESNMINVNNDKMENALNHRINSFPSCILEDYYKSNQYQTEEGIFEYMRHQGDIERKIKDIFEIIKQNIEQLEDINISVKNDLLKRLRRDKISMITERILFGPSDIPFNSNKHKCIINGMVSNVFNKLMDTYIIPQHKKILLLGRIDNIDLFKKCNTIFHILAGIWNINPLKKICSKYILWTLYLNRMYLIVSITKKMNIPIMIYVPDDKIISKRSSKKTILQIKQNKFIGIIQIPILNKNKTQISYYKYLFIFENNMNTVTRDYYNYNLITHYQIFDSELNKLAIGTNKLRTTVTFDELDGLYYMSNVYKEEYRAYFYRDPTIPNFIFVSAKSNLTDTSLYPTYSLERVYLEKWYEEGYKKQFIFYTDTSKESVEHKIKLNRNENKRVKINKTILREHTLNTSSFINYENPEYILITTDKI